MYFSQFTAKRLLSRQLTEAARSIVRVFRRKAIALAIEPFAAALVISLVFGVMPMALSALYSAIRILASVMRPMFRMPSFAALGPNPNKLNNPLENQ